MDEKLTEQVSFCADAQIAEQWKAAALEAGIRKLGPFSRELFIRAFGHYKNAGCLHNLKKARIIFPQVPVKKPRRK